MNLPLSAALVCVIAGYTVYVLIHLRQQPGRELWLLQLVAPRRKMPYGEKMLLTSSCCHGEGFGEKNFFSRKGPFFC